MSNSLDADVVLDLRGKVCPMTFVYTKVSLEKLEHGKILKVILDHEAAFRNVPKSVKVQNLGEIIYEEQVGNEKSLWIRRA